MSGTATVTSQDSKSQVQPQTLAARIGAALVEFDNAVAALGAADRQLGYARVKLGAVFAEKLADLAAKGKTGEEAQAAILRLLGSRLDGKTGKPYSWSTVESWIRAGETERTLPDEVRGVFNSDSLRTIRRVKANATEGSAVNFDERAAFAKALAEKGHTSVAQVRAAYAKQYGDGDANGKPKERTDLDHANRITAKLSPTVARSPKSAMTRNKLAYNMVAPFVLYGIALGMVAREVNGTATAASMVAQSQLGK